MSGGRSIDKERKSPRESGEDSEDESEILEESPCGRWLKRREEVSQFTSLLSHSYEGNANHYSWMSLDKDCQLMNEVSLSKTNKQLSITVLQHSSVCVLLQVCV